MMTTLNKVCIHWTAGTNKPCSTDLNSYHYCVDNNGKIYQGKYTPEDNINCYDGKYAAHCADGNTGCIGLSACGMYKFTENQKTTDYPLTQKQIESLCCLAGYLCTKYGISVEEDKVFTHYEFDHKKKKPKGKIDIIYLHFAPNLAKNSVGKYLRNKINWYKNQIKAGKYKFEKKGNYYEFINVS